MAHSPLPPFNRRHTRVAVQGDTTALPEVHAASAGLKSFCSTLAADGMEDARKCCGGHGYSHFSGLPDMVASYLLVYTGEGENYLMTCVVDTCERRLLAEDLASDSSNALLFYFLWARVA